MGCIPVRVGNCGEHQQLPPDLYLQATSMGRFSRMLRTWLRPHFLDPNFQGQAQERYIRFLELHRQHPEVTLVPTADIALMWHTHLGMSKEYAEACEKLFGAEAAPWRPDYLDLGDPAKLAGMYSETAQLYQEKYGEPYDGPDTAWLADSVPYPLVTSANPLAYALRVFDDNPQQAEQQTAIGLACRAAGLPAPQPGAPVVRSGAHALYLTWLAARRAEAAYDSLTCNGCCMTRNKTVHMQTLRDVNSALVSVAYFLELPDIDTHPYLLAITAGDKKWSPSPLAAPAVAAFKPSDPAHYLRGRESYLLQGLPLLLAATKRPPPTTAEISVQEPTSYESEPPLWQILKPEDMRTTAGDVCTSAWMVSANSGVGVMKHAFQTRRHRHEGCSLSGPCDYYSVADLTFVMKICTFYLHLILLCSFQELTLPDRFHTGVSQPFFRFKIQEENSTRRLEQNRRGSKNNEWHMLSAGAFTSALRCITWKSHLGRCITHYLPPDHYLQKDFAAPEVNNI
ncbi:hypothetical protein VOLCADRAFT_87985 [Volvox carteri f. nagariensis]|uniref:Uncharacterized protein n=1 Tax=Volvox carteri f. nagariensis TaxID=3068 RepID=D8TMS3_VOLCA|nr:uncharacterized protein VOLCADRAFT_87985 [Volvox carteri f. nagariensis]EFJ51301.1 hypothetical protein VOLCADRAFT_87985 [Volvox carteri f. nagariensis]|eukprot:XP_002947768.1 hypothetical protein VOLCADRAFT_87985 [Volvox carteri f. nagariensis]